MEKQEEEVRKQLNRIIKRLEDLELGFGGLAWHLGNDESEKEQNDQYFGGLIKELNQRVTNLEAKINNLPTK